jgi:hypothetical protein
MARPTGLMHFDTATHVSRSRWAIAQSAALVRESNQLCAETWRILATSRRLLGQSAAAEFERSPGGPASDEFLG